MPGKPNESVSEMFAPRSERESAVKERKKQDRHRKRRRWLSWLRRG